MLSLVSWQKMSITRGRPPPAPCASAADLVGEADLERVPHVVGVLDHLGQLAIGAAISGRRGASQTARPACARLSRRRRRSPSWADRRSRATALPSRRNSGYTATGTGRPAARSSSGSSTWRVVPGRTVLRTTTTMGDRWRWIACPMSPATRRRYVRSRLPLPLLGVPTQTKARSVSLTAASQSVVARRRPARTPSSMSSPSPASITGGWPWFNRSVLTGFVSTPTTRWPSAARQAAETAPT